MNWKDEFGRWHINGITDLEYKGKVKVKK